MMGRAANIARARYMNIYDERIGHGERFSASFGDGAVASSAGLQDVEAAGLYAHCLPRLLRAEAVEFLAALRRGGGGAGRYVD